MPEQLTRVIQPIKDKWTALDKQQKIKLIAAILVVLLALAITVYFTTRTKYTVFVDNLNGTQILEFENVLDEAGIRNRRASNGTAIEVDEARLADAKIEVEASPSTNAMSFTFNDALNASGMSATESVKREALRRAKEFELSQAIQSFDGVSLATVQLTIPDPVRFLVSESEKSTASVLVETTRDLTRNEGLAIARFVCRGVEGLEMENIEIYDNRYNTLYSGEQDTLGMGIGSVTEMQEQEKKQLMLLLRNMYLPIFNDVQITPNLIYDSVITADEHTSTITPPVADTDTGVPTRETTETRSVTGSPTADEPGLGTNDNAAPGYQTGTDGNYNAKEKTTDVYRDYNRSETVKSFGPGSYLRDASTIAVFLYRYIPYYQERMIERDNDFTQADWEDFKLENPQRIVSDDPNLTQYVSAIASATGIDTSRVSVTVWEVPIFYDFQRTPVKIQEIIMFAVLALLILMLAYGLIRHTRPEDEEEIEPELSVEDLLVSTQLEEEKEENEKLEEIDYFKDSEVKRQIEKFVNEKPEAVASLLRNWLNNEEW